MARGGGVVGEGGEATLRIPAAMVHTESLQCPKCVTASICVNVLGEGVVTSPYTPGNRGWKGLGAHPDHPPLWAGGSCPPGLRLEDHTEGTRATRKGRGHGPRARRGLAGEKDGLTQGLVHEQNPPPKSRRNTKR